MATASVPQNYPDARLPLPALLCGILVVVAMHLPLRDSPALLYESGVVEGSSSLESWLPGGRWLAFEREWFGESIASYRWSAVALEIIALVVLAFALSGRVASPSAGVWLLAAYWIHPLRTEQSVMIWLRPMLVGEFLVVCGLAFLVRARGMLTTGLAALFLAIGCLGAPALAALSVPALLLREGRRWALGSAGALLGAGLPLLWGWRRLVGGENEPWTVASVGARDLLWPLPTGLVHDAEGLRWLGLLAGIFGLLILMAGRSRRATAGCALACGLALLSARALRPIRADAQMLGSALTPEMFAPALLLALGAVFAFCQARGKRSWLAPLVLLATVPLGFERVREFASGPTLLAASFERFPDSTDLHLLAGDFELQGIESRSPAAWYPYAERALRHADFALRQGAGRKAQALRITALTYLGKPQEARVEADALIAQGGLDWQSLVLRGDVERVSGDRLEALRWFRAALNHEEHPVARARYRFALERCYQRIADAMVQGRAEAARNLCERLLSVVPDQQLAAEQRAHTFLLTGDPGGAREAFEAVLGRFSSSRVALKALINLCEASGDLQSAAEYRQRLFRLGGRAAFDEPSIDPRPARVEESDR